MIGLAAGYFVFVEIGIHRAFGRAPESPRVTLYHWNMSWPTAKRWGSFRESVPNDPAPDIAVITNPYPGAKLFSELAERLGPEFGTARSGRLAVVTRYTVLRSRGASLRVPPPWQFTDPDADIPDRDRIASNAAPTPGSGWFDEGHILMVELDTSEVFGRSTVIWAIDLPSDRRLARDRLTRYVARRIEQLETGEEAFPSPDILVGDLNIPRGSRSLDRLTKGLRDAHTIAGPGYRATWPRSFPLYHLDQTYLAPWLGVDSYRILDPGISEHRAQLLRITPGPS